MSVPARVLLVEDNAVIAMNTEFLLSDLGVEEVRTAATLADALALLEAAQFDFAILDLSLGNGETSLPIAERLSDQGIPIIFASGQGEDFAMPERYRDAQMLRKPYGFDELQQVVRKG